MLQLDLISGFGSKKLDESDPCGVRFHFERDDYEAPRVCVNELFYDGHFTYYNNGVYLKLDEIKALHKFLSFVLDK
ncbi:hypothetical protein A0256_23245 [Mucilaginibacter sp. PAMC 26640]|nr:hypothetical protein A0256_23245 [Mucilaginibacter sp. PAMC 26640]